MDKEELREHFILQTRLRELCDEAGIDRPLSKREMQIGILALAADPPGKSAWFENMDFSLAI